MIRGIAFDAYGTLFDVLSIGTVADRFFPGRGHELSLLWRTRQIDYTRIRTLSDRYQPFSRVTEDALVHATRALGLALHDAAREALMREYDRLALHPDVREALGRLATLGLPMAILSNGDPAMLDAIVAHHGLGDVFAHLLSVDAVRRFKTASEAYALGTSAFRCDASSIAFVSSNAWDACGATWFGYRSFWINRAGAPFEELGVEPEATGRSMGEAVDFVERLSNVGSRAINIAGPNPHPLPETS